MPTYLHTSVTSMKTFRDFPGAQGKMKTVDSLQKLKTSCRKWVGLVDHQINCPLDVHYAN